MARSKPHKPDPLLREVALGEVPDGWRDRFPFRVPTIGSLRALALQSRVTFFVGENGTGKSTLLEAIALAAGLAYDGGSRNFRPAPRASFQGESQEALIGMLADALRLRWRKRPRDAFFLRAESLANVVNYLEDVENADPLNAGAFNAYGGRSLHTRSHGESFLTVLMNRISGGGLYLVDEPEAALSAARQLALLVRMRELLERDGDTQFIIATHSPIVLAFPGARIFSFDRGRIEEVAYRQTDAFVITRRFLDDPERGLRELFAPPEPEGEQP